MNESCRVESNRISRRDTRPATMAKEKIAASAVLRCLHLHLLLLLHSLVIDGVSLSKMLVFGDWSVDESLYNYYLHQLIICICPGSLCTMGYGQEGS
jgi:hypothetical protein